MKIGQLLLIKEPLKKILQSSIPIKYAYTLSRDTNKFFEEIGHAEEFRDTLLSKYVKPDEKGNALIPPERREEFTQEYNELLSQDYEVDFSPIDLNILLETDVKITPIEMRILIEVGIIRE